MVTTQWLGGSGAWDDPANWSNGVPGPADTAVFGTGGFETVSGSGSVGTLDIFGGSVTLTGDIGAAAVMIGSQNSTVERLTIAPGATLADSGRLDIPTFLGSSDQLIVQGQLVDSSANIGSGLDAGIAAVTVTGAGAVWKTSGTVNLTSSGLFITERHGGGECDRYPLL